MATNTKVTAGTVTTASGKKMLVMICTQKNNQNKMENIKVKRRQSRNKIVTIVFQLKLPPAHLEVRY
jgi:hypothetical protein